MMSAKDKKS